MTTKIKILSLMAVLLLIAACGGGGGGNGAATRATLKLITSGTGTTTIYGIDATVNLPEGVTLKSSNPPQADGDVITPSGVAASGTIATAVSIAASGTVPAKVRILLVNANGFTTGEFCMVNGDIAEGHSPKAEDFSLDNFAASDENGNVLTGLTPEFSVDIL